MENNNLRYKVIEGSNGIFTNDSDNYFFLVSVHNSDMNEITNWEIIKGQTLNKILITSNKVTTDILKNCTKNLVQYRDLQINNAMAKYILIAEIV